MYWFGWQFQSVSWTGTLPFGRRTQWMRKVPEYGT